MDSDNSQPQNPANQQLQKFLFTFHKHWKNTYPKVFQTQDLLKNIEKKILSSDEQVNQVEVEDIQKELANALRTTPKFNKNGIMIIGPPGVGKTAFMKFYAKKHFKILINASCCSLMSTFRHQAVDVIDILFQMANFDKETLLFFDQIDLLMNDENFFPNMHGIRKSLLKNLTRSDYSTPVIYSTNKPWKITDKEFLSTIHCSIEISVSSFEKRKELIKMILQDSKCENIDTSGIDVDDIAQRTLNYLNSDIYVLVRQILMQPYRELVMNGDYSLESIKNSKMKISKQHIEKAYQKIRPSILTSEIAQYKEWSQKFQQQNQ